MKAVDQPLVAAWLAPWILLAACAASAQEPQATTAAGAATLYQVEVIVFRYDTSARETAGGLTAAAQSSAGESWTALAPDELRLSPTAARLRRPGLYQLLYHGGWTQPAAARNRATAVPLPAEASGLTGTVTLYRERYLHAAVDLRLDVATEGAAPRISETRRLKGPALQYFDDAAFGVILQVRPVTANRPPAAPGAPPPPPR